MLLACNHVSYVDFIYAGLAANPSGRLVRFMAKQEMFRPPRSAGPVMRSMHHIPVDRGEGSSRSRPRSSYLRSGEAVGIFPEATISRAMELKDVQDRRGADRRRGARCRWSRSSSGAPSGW